MYMFVVQLFTVYSVCSYITCQGQDVFLTRVLPSSLVCGSLCTYTTRCGSFIWDAASSSCHLHTRGETETGTMPVQKSGKGSQRMTCHTRPCKEEEVCVPAEAGVKYLCLASGVTTPTTAAPVTATTTTLSTTTIATPITTTTTTLSTTFTTTPVTTTTTTLSTTSTTTPVTTTTTTLSTTSTTTPVTTTTTTPKTPITTTTTTCIVTVSYTYAGCYQDDAGRVLPRCLMKDETGLTPDSCSLHCHQNSFTHFGTQVGHECYCGNIIKTGYAKRRDTECNMPCTGDRSRCGGQWRISIYTIG
ncbi:uncharacterized protein [Haliotis cracherodii]|uniref:uncharacterized protein n=1 Tax=Haliotis cracherodii TaxID=6455 RepID=UPI0039EC5992